MKLIILLIFSTISFELMAKEKQLKTGDIVLISLPCFSCRLIELETGSLYSHSGIILEENSKLYVLEALGSVKKTSYQNFIAMRTKDSKIGFYRFRSSDNFSSDKIAEHFYRNYENLKFDPLYLWDNRDEEGNDLLYCSEFISKFFYSLTGINYFPAKPMSYQRYENYWRNIFRGPPPEGELGNSPEDLASSPYLFEL